MHHHRQITREAGFFDDIAPKKLGQPKVWSCTGWIDHLLAPSGLWQPPFFFLKTIIGNLDGRKTRNKRYSSRATVPLLCTRHSCAIYHWGSLVGTKPAELLSEHVVETGCWIVTVTNWRPGGHNIWVFPVASHWNRYSTYRIYGQLQLLLTKFCTIRWLKKAAVFAGISCCPRHLLYRTFLVDLRIVFLVE